jgi:nucleotide-binding universal stress UspA family protein
VWFGLEHEQPYQAIIDTAQNRGCDVIQMVSHGRRGVSAILHGSETLKVLTHSAIPVIVSHRPRPAIFRDTFCRVVRLTGEGRGRRSTR